MDIYAEHTGDILPTFFFFRTDFQIYLVSKSRYLVE